MTDPSCSGHNGVSIVVPVFNGEPTIAELSERVSLALDGVVDWELIFVVDGSPDQSWARVQELARGLPNVVGIQLSRNYGQHNALLAGIRAARFPVTVTMDDDLQHRPENIMTLVGQLSDDVDLVYARPDDLEFSALRRMSSRTVKLGLGLTVGGEMATAINAFRAFKTPLREGFKGVDDSFVSIDVLLAWVTTGYTTVPAPMDVRLHGKSNYTFGKLAAHALNMITGYSTKPLRLVVWFGFGFSILGFASLVFVLIRYMLDGSQVPGFAFLASLVAIFGGAQLFSLGLIGEYLGRIHVRSMGRPTYVIRDAIGGAPNASDQSNADTYASINPDVDG